MSSSYIGHNRHRRLSDCTKSFHLTKFAHTHLNNSRFIFRHNIEHSKRKTYLAISVALSLKDI